MGFWSSAGQPATPERYGAAGNGIRNDAANIQAGIDAVAAAGGGDFCFCGRTYVIGSTTITVPISVTLRAERSAELRYNGFGVALDVYGNVESGARILDLPHVQRGNGPEWDAGTDTTSVGVRLNACHYDTIHCGEIRNFRRGLVLRALPNSGDQANGGDVVCNTIYVGQNINNWRGIDFQHHPAANGFSLAGVNQNTFIGGAIRIDSAWNHEVGRTAIHMPDAENNVNTFVGLNLEGTATERAIYCGSQENLWLNCRLEGSPAGAVTFTDTAINNTIIGGRTTSISDGIWDAVVSDSGHANRVIWGNVLSGKYNTLDFNSGKLLFGNGSAAPATPMQGYGTNRLQFGDATHLGQRGFGYSRQEAFTQASGTTLTAGHDHYNLTHSSPTTVTGISGGVPADIEGVVSIIATTFNVTLQHNASPSSAAGKFVLSGGSDIQLSVRRPVLFRTFDGNLYQV